MTDFPAQTMAFPANTVINTGSSASLLSDIKPSNSWGGSAVWPAANRALYLPFIIEQQVTAVQMFMQIATQSGNCDVGIYDENGVRLVSMGSTAVGAAGIQVFNIADTVLGPGLYYMALNVDNVIAAIFRASISALIGQLVGVQQQAVGAVTLPNPATFANPAVGFWPMMGVAFKSTL